MVNRKSAQPGATAKKEDVPSAAPVDTGDASLKPSRTTPSSDHSSADVIWSSTEVISMPPDLGKRLAALRAERKMTQADLANLLGKSRTTVNQYEMGNITPPLPMIDEMANALQVDPVLLAYGREGSTATHVDRLWLLRNDKRTEDFVELSPGLRDRLQLSSDSSCVVELPADSPHFGLKRGDQLFIDLRHKTILGDGRLYAVRSGGGDLNLVRSEIQLEGKAEHVRITFGQGQVSEVVAQKVDVIGTVRGTLRVE